MRVLSIGECMAELSPVASSDQYRLGFAGDTFNTAWYLARLNPEIGVSFFTTIGDDTISENLRDFIVQSGIEADHISNLPNQTVGLYLISLDKGERSFSYWRGQSAARHLADDPNKLAVAIDGADLIYFSGITLAILSAQSRVTFLEQLKQARAKGKIIAFDPNLRPKLWESPQVMMETVMEGARTCDIALPSFEDEANWWKDENPKATLERYHEAGALKVVVKNGAGAVCFRDRNLDGENLVTSVDSIVDTTAAGDSFNAAILAGLADNETLSESVSRACKLAGKVVQGEGALVPVAIDEIV